MSQYVIMLLVLVMFRMSSAEITDDVRNANKDRVTQKADADGSIASNNVTPTASKHNANDTRCTTKPARTICLTQPDCEKNCIGLPNEKCQKMNLKFVKNLLVLYNKNKTSKLKPKSVVEDGFVCTLDGKVPHEDWPMITITSDNATGETRKYYSDMWCKDECTFDCVERKSTDQIKKSLKKQNLQGLQLYECEPTPLWVWALVVVVVGILVLLGLFICILWCCCASCCGSCCYCFTCCSDGDSKTKEEAANTAQLESGRNLQAPSQVKTDAVVNVVSTPPITPPRSPPQEHSSRSERSSRSSSHGSSKPQSRRPSSRLKPYDRNPSSLSGSGTR